MYLDGRSCWNGGKIADKRVTGSKAHGDLVKQLVL